MKIGETEEILEKARKIKKGKPRKRGGKSLPKEESAVIYQAEMALILEKIYELEKEAKELTDGDFIDFERRKEVLINAAWDKKCFLCQEEIQEGGYIFPAIFLLGWAVKSGREIPSSGDFSLILSYLEPEDFAGKFSCLKCKPEIEERLQRQSFVHLNKNNGKMHYPSWLLDKWAEAKAAKEAREKREKARKREGIEEQIRSLNEALEAKRDQLSLFKKE